MKHALVTTALVVLFIALAIAGAQPTEAARVNSLDLLWIASGATLIARTLRAVNHQESEPLKEQS